MKQEKHIKQLVYSSVGILFCIMMLTYLGWRGYRYYLYYQLRQAPQVELNSRFLGNGRINSQTISSLNRNRRKAQDKGYNRYASGILKIPSIKVDLPIFSGINRYTLSLGVAKDYYYDSQMGKGNYVLAGHNMRLPGVLLSDLKSVKVGDRVYLYNKHYRFSYQVYSNRVVSPYVKLVDGIPAKGSAYWLPTGKQTPIVTVYDCAQVGHKRRVVQGKLISKGKIKKGEINQ